MAYKGKGHIEEDLAEGQQSEGQGDSEEEVLGTQ